MLIIRDKNNLLYFLIYFRIFLKWDLLEYISKCKVGNVLHPVCEAAQSQHTIETNTVDVIITEIWLWPV